MIRGAEPRRPGRAGTVKQPAGRRKPRGADGERGVGGQGGESSWPGSVGAPAELRLAAELSESLIAEARKAGPEEACGILVGRREPRRSLVVRTVSCQNVAPEGTRRRRFEIDPRRLIEQERALRGSGEQVVGFYHSHPAGDPVPSRVDRTYMALWPDMVWVIVGAGAAEDRSRVRAWNFRAEREEALSEVQILPAKEDEATSSRC